MFPTCWICTKIKKAKFDKLPEDLRTEWQEKVKEKSLKVMQEWKTCMEAGPSTAPEDCQWYVDPFSFSHSLLTLFMLSCIQGLATFVQPILDGISALTGLQVTMLTGGPEPADRGHLNVIR
jgi:hypothetical protein